MQFRFKVNSVEAKLRNDNNYNFCNSQNGYLSRWVLQFILISLHILTETVLLSILYNVELGCYWYEHLC